MPDDDQTTPSASAAESRLDQLLRTLDAGKLVLLERMAEALAVPVVVDRRESDLVDDAFADSFSNFLLLHHAVHEEPLNKEAFEYVLKGCALAGGHSAEINPHRGPANWDVKYDDTKWSLKTEAARGISVNAAKIEKFMEARWIRGCTNPAKCAEAVRRELPAHMAGYDRILILRALRLKGASIRYEIIEPPKQIMDDRLSRIEHDAFTKEGSKESYGAEVETPGGDRIFRILLDSSVEKVRFTFPLTQCEHHGSWTVRPHSVQEAAIEAVHEAATEVALDLKVDDRLF
jgi:hypothetical protein